MNMKYEHKKHRRLRNYRMMVGCEAAGRPPAATADGSNDLVHPQNHTPALFVKVLSTVLTETHKITAIYALLSCYDLLATNTLSAIHVIPFNVKCFIYFGTKVKSKGWLIAVLVYTMFLNLNLYFFCKSENDHVSISFKHAVSTRQT